MSKFNFNKTNNFLPKLNSYFRWCTEFDRRKAYSQLSIESISNHIERNHEFLNNFLLQTWCMTYLKCKRHIRFCIFRSCLSWLYRFSSLIICIPPYINLNIYRRSNIHLCTLCICHWYRRRCSWSCYMDFACNCCYWKHQQNIRSRMMYNYPQGKSDNYSNNW